LHIALTKEIVTRNEWLLFFPKEIVYYSLLFNLVSYTVAITMLVYMFGLAESLTSNFVTNPKHDYA
jgi:hypothetical protein